MKKIFWRLRIWLIILLAGRRLVVVNADFRAVRVLVPTNTDAVFVACRFKGGVGPAEITVRDRDVHHAEIKKIFEGK